MDFDTHRLRHHGGANLITTKVHEGKNELATKGTKGETSRPRVPMYPPPQMCFALNLMRELLAGLEEIVGNTGVLQSRKVRAPSG